MKMLFKVKSTKGVGGWRGSECFKPKACPVCSTEFQPKSGVHKYCSAKCKGKAKYLNGSCTTETQYKQISGNWGRYFCRLRQSGVRLNAKWMSRKNITTEYLHELFAQQKGKCALTGEELTCFLEKGIKFHTNASLDRIDSSKGYELGNVRLVCAIVNLMKSELDDEDLVWWCRQIVKHHGCKTKKTSA